MKTIIYIIGLLGFLMAPISAKAIEEDRGEFQPAVWVMSIEICKDFPPQLQDAIKRGIVFKHWLTQQCRWFGVGINDLMGVHQENELAIWPSYQECMDYDIDIREGFTLRKKFCQPIEVYNPDKPRRRN